jgi:hypothetical protein
MPSASFSNLLLLLQKTFPVARIGVLHGNIVQVRIMANYNIDGKAFGRTALSNYACRDTAAEQQQV